MVSEQLKKELLSVRQFIMDFSDKLSSDELEAPAKQVLFLDNKQKVKDSFELLQVIQDTIGENPENEDKQLYDLTEILKSTLTDTLTEFRNSYNTIKSDVTVEETTAIVTEDTIKEAAKNNASTRQLVKDMSELDEKANTAQIQDITHAILAGKKFLYTKATTKEELNLFVNQVAEENPNVDIKLYQVVLNPIPLKTKTTYTV